MKIYSCPKECLAPRPDYSSYDADKENAREENHMARLKAHLISIGYTGEHTGKIYGEGVADGRALYMVADGAKSCLIHLPYGDGYQSRDVQFVPKKEIIRRIRASEELGNLFQN